MGLEIVQDVPDLDAVIIPVGGGGLLAGRAPPSSAQTLARASSASNRNAHQRCRLLCRQGM